LRWQKEYKLTDGTFTTVLEVSTEVGCPLTTAAGRLSRHSDRAKVFAPWNARRSKKTKIYTLDNGQKVTSKEVAREVGCHISLARTRLSITSDPKKVFAPKAEIKKAEDSATISSSYAMRKIMSRGMFDPMMVLAMKSI
jgi:hypothetical protein